MEGTLLRSKLRHALKLAVAAALAATAISGTTTTDAAASRPSSGTTCVIVLAKIKPGENFSREISRKCSDDMADLREAREARVPLVFIHAEADYKGHSEHYYGEEPCDAAGYGWREFTWSIDNAVSSLQVFNGCRWSQMYAEVNYGGDVKYGVDNYPFVGHEMNDRMSSLIVHA